MVAGHFQHSLVAKSVPVYGEPKNERLGDQDHARVVEVNIGHGLRLSVRLRDSTTAPLPGATTLGRSCMAVATTSPASTLHAPSQPQPRAAWSVPGQRCRVGHA